MTDVLTVFLQQIHHSAGQRWNEPSAQVSSHQTAHIQIRYPKTRQNGLLIDFSKAEDKSTK